ncbi:MAG: HPr family phosphocarrier protein [Candidatus Krumholzibacteriota bacterium]|nr:HPr family phosphocarrier protein [Candidatus Krumholzibacteriota bacterium]
MLEFTRKINNKIGLHLRAAGELVKVAAQFTSNITVYNGDQSANGKSILGLASLAAARGALLRIEIDGPDDEAARRALETLFDNNFYED